MKLLMHLISLLVQLCYEYYKCMMVKMSLSTIHYYFPHSGYERELLFFAHFYIIEGKTSIQNAQIRRY